MADDKVFIHKDPSLTNNGFAVMEEIRRHGKLCDVTLRVGDQKFTAHRIVLAATIPYFQAMFTHDMVEAKQDEINMQGIDASALEALINFAYSSQIQIDSDNVQSILIGSNFLNLYEVKEVCCRFLIKRLQPSNVLSIRGFAEQLLESTLITAANSYLNRNFTDVVKCDEFLLLSFEDIQEIVSRDELNVKSEEKVYEACLTWIKKDPESRGDRLYDLLKNVRLHLLTPQYLADVVGTEELIKRSHPCRDKLDDAKNYHLMPERRASVDSFSTQPRRCTEIVEDILAVGGLTSSGDSVSTVELYDPISSIWKKTTPMSTLRSRVGVVTLDGLLYAIGGYNGSDRLDTVEVFNPKKKKWKLVAPMTCQRSALGATALCGRVYVCGGYDGRTSLDTVECYTPSTDEWKAVTRMTRPRSAAGIVSFDGHIYALGGHDGLSIFDSVECFNNLTGKWTPVKSMLSKRCRLGAATLNGKLYATGGYDGQRFLKTCEMYDPVTNTWEYVAPMIVQRSRVALVPSCGRLYAIGGYDGQNNLTCVEIYDPLVNQWVMGPPMVAHEGGVGVGALPKIFTVSLPTVSSNSPRDYKPALENSEDEPSRHVSF